MSPDRPDPPHPPASGRPRSGDDERGRLDRLPPPAFPPGSRRREGLAAPSATAGDGVPDEAFIHPDEPFARSTAPAAPRDTPPPRTPRLDTPGLDHGDEDGVVTGLDLDPHLGGEGTPAPVRAGADPLLEQLVEQVGRLAEGLRERGEVALKVTPGMTSFEGTLRAYCVGWLSARREAAHDG